MYVFTFIQFANCLLDNNGISESAYFVVAVTINLAYKSTQSTKCNHFIVVSIITDNGIFIFQ